MSEFIYTKENPLRVCTLCSGYDSQCCALDRLGIPYELVAWSEFDPDSKSPIDKQPAVIAHNVLFPQWKDRNLGDMTKVDWSKVPDFDLLTYSTPCQSVSNAGLQHGITEGSGTRSSILWSTRYAIIEKKPKYLLMENVKALVSKKFIGEFQKWCRELESYGYTNYSKVLNASQHGVPQNRERIFVVSILGDHKPFHFPQPIPLEKRLKDVLEPEVDDKYVLSDKAIEGFLEHNKNHEEKGTGFI